MCKLFIMTNTSELKKETIDKLIRSTSKSMHSTERDGFGFSINGNKGVFNRRFLNPLDACLVPKTYNYKFLKQNVNQDGELDSIDSLIMHGRTSTNVLGLKNTHPISKHGISLCHNGVVEDSGPEFDMVTDNDTEFLVERLRDGVDSIEKHISGYYAFAAYKDNQLIIVRDSIAPLYFTELISYNCHVFATTRDLLKTVLKSAGLKHGPISELEDNIKLVYQGKDLISQDRISPKGRSSYADSMAEKSLGYSMDSIVDYTRDDIDLGEERFLIEIETEADHTWTFFKGRHSYTFEEFLNLPYYDQVTCMVIRSDGSICSPDDKNNGLFYQGNIA